MKTSTQGTPPNVEPSINKPQRRAYKKRSKDQWKSMVSAYESSDLSHVAFCKQHRIAPSNLYKWRNYFAEQAPNSEFIDITEPLSVTSPSPVAQSDSAWQVELTFGRGMVLRLRTS